MDSIRAIITSRSYNMGEERVIYLEPNPVFE
jgi:hypothetical protein